MVYLEKTEKKLKKNDLVRVRLLKNSEHKIIGQILQKKD